MHLAAFSDVDGLHKSINYSALVAELLQG